MKSRNMANQGDQPMDFDSQEGDYVVKEMDVFLAKSLVNTLYLLQVGFFF
jgi:hypothetical protein